MIIFGRWIYSGYISFPSESCIEHTLKNQIIWISILQISFKCWKQEENLLLWFLGCFWLQCSKNLCELGRLHNFFFLIDYPDINISESHSLLVMCNMKKMMLNGKNINL